MNYLKGIIKAQELKKNQTLKQVSPYPNGAIAGERNSVKGRVLAIPLERGEGNVNIGGISGEFNINLNPVHIDKTKNINPTISSARSFAEARLEKLKASNYVGQLAWQKKKGKPSSFSTVISSNLPQNWEGAKFSSGEDMQGAVKTSTSLQGYLRNNTAHAPSIDSGISLIPKIGLKNGLLLNYQKFISYKFNMASSYPTTSATSAPFAFADKGRLSNFYNKNGNSPYAIAPQYAKAEVKDIYNLLYYFFKSIYCLISKPVFLDSADKLIIQLFYYLSIPKKKVFKFFSIMYISSFKNKWLKKNSQAFSIRKNNHKFNSLFNTRKSLNLVPKFFIKWRVRKSISRLRSKNSNVRSLLFNLRKFNLSKIFHRKFDFICQILSKKFNKSVEFQLIRLHQPYHDTNILINLLSLNIRNKSKNARVAINKIYAKNQIKIINDPNLNPINLIPAYLSGINIKIAGRLMREPIIPRITTKTYEKGASSTGKVNYLDVASITKKNRKGAYTIKIKSGQNFFMPAKAASL